MEHGPFATEAIRPELPFAAPSGAEARDELAGEDKEDGPSLHDVKRALKHNFRATGVIDDVTARLRRQFVLELRRKGLGVAGAREAVAGGTRSSNGISLRERVFHSLVVDYLASNGLLQSLAVFLPESGLGADANTPVAAAALSREDVLEALSLPADSALFRRVISRAAAAAVAEGAGRDQPAAAAAAAGAAVVLTASAAVPEDGRWPAGGRSQQQQQEQRRVCGLLEALVGEVAARSRAVAVDCKTQTEEAGRSHKENLASRLEAVRETWLKRSADERREPAQDVTERMLAFQRDCESRAAAQIKAEREAFRERDLAALRLQMTSAQRREADATRKELQSHYDARVEGLREAERGRERRDRDRLRDAEVSQFEARQNLLREMDLLRTREQEIRRAAELDARAVRAEELRLRDLAVSLEARAEEVRRREREVARGREDAVEAAKHEARQSLEIKEEGVAREREFLKKEMDAVRAERKACQEQLSQHTETSRALQEARGKALAQEARAAAAEEEAERMAEQVAVYKEAYQMRREVAVEGDRAFVQLGRPELEERVRSLEASAEEERARQAKALRKAIAERDALKLRVGGFGKREQQWEAEATELSRALSRAELDRDRAERRAEEEECERSALDGQVEELRAALRRSRDAIEAIRLCDVEVEASSSAAALAAAAAVAERALPAAAAAAAPEVMRADTGPHPHGHNNSHTLSSTLGTGWAASPRGQHFRAASALSGGDDGRWDGSWRQSVAQASGDGYEPAPGFFRRRGVGLGGGGGGGGSHGWSPGGAAVPEYHGREHFEGGEWFTQAVSSGDDDAHRRPVRRRGRDGRRGVRRSRGGRPVAEGECWSDGDVDVEYASGGGGGGGGSDGDGRRSRSERRPRSRHDKRGNGGGHGAGAGAGLLSIRSTPGRRGASAGDTLDPHNRRGGNRTWENESNGPSSSEDDSEGGAADGGGRGRGRRHRSRDGGRRRRSSDRADVLPAAAAGAAVAGERIEAAELLLAEERERMARDLEAERARLRERDARREEERRREREADRVRREELEVESMRRRLEEEEDRAAAATAARRRTSRADAERRRARNELDQKENHRGDRYTEGRETRHSVRQSSEGGIGEEEESEAKRARQRRDACQQGGDGEAAVRADPDVVEEAALGRRPGPGPARAQRDASPAAPSSSSESPPCQPSSSGPPQESATTTPAARAGTAEAMEAVPSRGGEDGGRSGPPSSASPTATSTALETAPKSPAFGSGAPPHLHAAAAVQAPGSSPMQAGNKLTTPRQEAAAGEQGLGAESPSSPQPYGGGGWGKAAVVPGEAEEERGTGSSSRAAAHGVGEEAGATDARGGGSDEAGGEKGEGGSSSGRGDDGRSEPPPPREEAGADDVAKAQADREVHEYRAKIRQRRQQQQQQQQQRRQGQSHQTPRMAEIATGGPTIAAVPGERRAQNAATGWPGSKGSSSGGGGGGSVSELSEHSAGTGGNLEVGGGQSSDREEAEQISPKPSGEELGAHGGGGSTTGVDEAGTRRHDELASESIAADNSVRGGGGSGSSGGFLGGGGDSEGSENDWF